MELEYTFGVIRADIPRYAQIDPTNSHSSSHPVEVDGVVAFNIKQSEDDTVSTVSVSEITTRHIRRLRQSAEDFLGKKIDGAVLTVPTDFTDSQKKALSDACAAAELPILQIIHEPVAALLAYDSRNNEPGDKLTVVADIGGTRSDASVVAVRGGMYTILATAHDYELGGNKLDQALVDHFAKEFLKKYKSDPRENPRSLEKLKAEAEGTKKTLSLSTTATISIDSLADGYDFHSTINRLRFELLSRKVLDDIVALVENVVKKAGLDVLDIDEVVLAGGVANTPKVASRIAALFPETTVVHAPSTSATALNPSELDARGAAVQASLIAEYDQEDIDQSSHPAVTVAPHLVKSLGVAVVRDGKEEFHPVFHQQTAAPARKSANFDVDVDGDVLVKIAEGTREIHSYTPEKPPKEEGAEEGDDDDDDSEPESDEEPEEVREKKWKVANVIAELKVKDVKKGQKVEVAINIGPDAGLNVTARVIGGNAVRGAVPAPAS